MKVINAFDNNVYDESFIIYNSFKNAAVQELINEKFLPVEEQVAIIYCGSTGIISSIPTHKVKEFESNFLELMRNKHRAELDVLKSGKLTSEVTDVIKKVVAEMSKSYAE